MEELAEDDEELEEEIEEEEPVTTTEASRRLKAGVVRPFRSNDDLLAALKRRRVEAANGNFSTLIFLPAVVSVASPFYTSQ